MPSLAFSTLVLGFAGALYRGDDSTFYAFVVLCGLYCLLEPAVSSYLDRNLIYNKSISVPSHAKHDERRFATYPSPIMNTWYHLLDSDEVKAGSVREFRALNRVFVLWRDKEGNAVCQDAFCIHLGANLAQGGKIVDGCLQCPFHNWKFAADGTVVEVPYLKNPQMCQTGKKLHTYPVKEWCGMIFVYFHADGKEPEFQLPEFVTRDMAEGRWVPFMKWDTGFVRFSPIDFVDQAGDHAHFQTLHNDFMIPWTMIYPPQWLLNIFPIGICHTCTTYRGDDPAWVQQVATTGWGCVDPKLIFFDDLAGITWNNKPVESTLAATKEMYVGPAMINFHIPFTIGSLKAFVTIVPCDGGSIMRVRTFVDGRTGSNPLLLAIAWLVAGISASQLTADNKILEHKIRLKKPMIQPYDGPYNRTNAWLRQFYSEGSERAARCAQESYKNDW